MAEPEINPPDAPTLPPGDLDPNLIYIAIGKAIHRWEQMEEAFARLYLKLVALPDIPEHYLSFGQRNGTFAKRMDAIASAAEKFFVKAPDQHKEGEFVELIRLAQDLSIERHRIAHGHITMWGEFKLPDNLQRGVPFTMTSIFHYRWAPPFYGVRKLRTNPIGVNGAAIDQISEQFEVLHNRIFGFTEAL